MQACILYYQLISESNSLVAYWICTRYKLLLLLVVIVVILDLWDEVLVEWGFVLPGSNLPLSRLRKVDGMDRWLMLCYIHDQLLVHSDGHIPWLSPLGEDAEMV